MAPCPDGTLSTPQKLVGRLQFVGGTRALAHSIWRCRAGEVAKASLLPGVLPVPPTPPLSMFFESHPKKRRSRLHFGAFLHLEDFQFGEKWFFSKILHIAGVLAFFGDLGGIKKSSKKQINSQKNHGSRKALFRNGFWSIFGSCFYNFQGAKHCKIQCFCIFCVERQQREMLQKHRKYRCF